jgi:CheY-like chemotaxis protein
MKTDHSPHILVVEDDTFLLKVYLERLREEGYDVAVATNGEEALSMAAQKTPALIVLDMILPRMSGFDFLKMIKREEALKKIPVIILSNLGQDTDIETAKKLGATDYLVKADHSFRSVIEKIRSTIEESPEKKSRLHTPLCVPLGLIYQTGVSKLLNCGNALGSFRC